jgi:hypothetical protein
MSAYTTAANYVLDTLWEDERFRQYFYDLGAELADLGPLIQKVFEPCYLELKAGLDQTALQMLESQVTVDLLNPLQQNPQFRQMWAEWDTETREEFVKEQSELQLARLLIQVYDQQFAAAYRQAYSAYLAHKDQDEA